MTYTMRSLMFACSAAALGVLLAGCTPTIRLAASPGETPGITMGPFTSGSQSATSTITVEAVNNFAGAVTLSASCCQEVVRNQWVPLDGTGKFVWSFSQNSLNIPANGSASATLNLFIPAVPFTNSPSVAFGKYVVPVVAKDQAGKIADQTTNVGVKVLPASDPRPFCQPSTAVHILPLSSMFDVFITAAEANPRKQRLVIAIMPTTIPDRWKWTIEEGTVSPSSALIILKNSVSWEKEVSTVGCSLLPSNYVRVPGGSTGQIYLHEGVDSTLIFRKPVCADLLCLTTTWTNVAVFPEPAFWTVFGGRTHTFEWVQD
jgi:hypothetical protein